ncbi:hypothetical protein J3R82DRAFT_10745 [Butyriboletus roseoflavus]|nr:hypothetical protein J3R82DRAFT_10745 [Butyriboletus roseoflavus]
MTMTVEKLEERWTPTTVQATYVFCPEQPSSSGSGRISVNFPLLNLGWSFALSLAPAFESFKASRTLKGGRGGKRQTTKPLACNQWIPSAFSFRRDSSKISWGKTSMQAQLSLVMEQYDCGDASRLDECTPQNVGSNSTPLGTMKVVLAHTCSMDVPLTTSCTLPLHQLTKVSLTVTISECPFADGLFETSHHETEAQAWAWLVKQSGDRLLSRILTTGKLSSVKFLTSSTRSTPGHTGKLLTTYASLPVLEEHVNLSSAKLGEEWRSALAALNRHDNADAKHVWEFSCPNNYDYELDSDFEDDDEALPTVELCASSSSYEHNLDTLEAQQLESSTERSSGSFSSFELEGASDQGSFDNQPEEIIKGPGEPLRPSSAAAADEKRTVLVKFAAHRTWYAFLWYCYTGRLEFSKLKSQVESGAQRLRATHLEGGPLPCSPKSMYRLADLVDDKPLKAKALVAIKERMTERNVLDETFSEFTSKYPEVQEAQLGVLMEHCRSPVVKKAFLRTMFSTMPHAEPALSAFYDRLLRHASGTEKQRGFYG